MPPLSDILLVVTAVLVAMAPMTASFLQCWADRARGGIIHAPDGRSYCDSCGKTLGAIDLVPVLSWLWNRGKSRCCKEPLSPALLWPEAAAFGFALWGAIAVSSMLAVPTVALVWALQIVILLHALRPDVSNGTVGVMVLLGLGLSAGGLTGAFWLHAAGLAAGLAVVALSRVVASLHAYSTPAILLAAAGALVGLWLLPVAAAAGALLTLAYKGLAPALGLPHAEWPHAATVGLSGGLWVTWLYGVAV